VHIIKVTNDELVDAITRRAKELGITHGVIVSLIGAVDSFTVSTMPRNDATKDTITRYARLLQFMRRPAPRLAGLPGFLGLWLVGARWAEIGRR
jgi:hypothetical protein